MTTKWWNATLLGAGMVLALVLTASGESSLKLATTTSTYDSGLLDHIVLPFEEKHAVDVHIISVGTGKAIRLGKNGDVDAVLVHARSEEDEFVEKGYGVGRRDVMHNDFIILGAKGDPAKVSGMKDAGKALKKIAASKSTFVSRGDDSGTHKKEKSLWAAADVQPSGAWYLQVGQGMSAALRIADEKDAYVLVDRGTYLADKDSLRIVPAVQGDSDLSNPYGVIAVNPQLHKHVEFELATAFIGWLTSRECQEMIGEYKKGGEQLFHPNALQSEQ